MSETSSWRLFRNFVLSPEISSDIRRYRFLS